MSDQSVDFTKLIADMKNARNDATAERPTILGGRFVPDRLDDFLAAWQERWAKMPWRIWERVSEITIEYGTRPDAWDYVQRAEVFGEGGHLSLRRDGARWLWHYIGPTDQPPPEGFPRAEHSEECINFWTPTRKADLRRYAERVLLWGERKEGYDFWWEDRVAAAKLMYPGQQAGRVYLNFWRFTEAGQTVFVWYRDLDGGGQ